MIESCLKNAKDIIDGIFIFDRGSTDNTVHLAEQFIVNSKIPGKVYQQEGEDPSDLRLRAIQETQQKIQDLGFSLSNTYLLFLNADEALTIHPDFVREKLKEDSYLLLHHSLDVYFYGPCLVRASLPCERVSLLSQHHPYERSYPYEKLTTLVIDDLQYPSSKVDKQIDELLQSLNKTPDDIHHMLSLAHGYQKLKNYQQAIKWYKACIEKGGSKELVWFATMMVGECYNRKGQAEHALSWYLQAFQSSPDRPEPLKKLSLHYRQRQQYDIAYLYAKQGSMITPHEDHFIYVFDPTSHYQFDEELSIVSYYTPYKNDGDTAINKLLLTKNVPTHIKHQAYKNMLFYVKNIEQAQFQPISIHLPSIHDQSPLHYHLMNSSIKKTEKGYKLICRTVNFNQRYGKEYKTIDPNEKRIRTKNFMVLYDRDLNFISQKEIVENLPRIKMSLANKRDVEGLEDCRQIQSSDEDWFTCTTYDTNPTGSLQISLCKLSDQSASETLQVEKLIPLIGPDPIRHEKNWLPFMKNGELHAFYSYDPWSVYKIEGDTGICQEILNENPDQDYSNFRGSAGPVEFNDGYLVLVHEVIFAQQRYYMHRFLYLDRNFKIKKMSKPFTFLHKGVEYCLGMTVDHSGNKLIMSVSIEDREAYFCTVDLAYINFLLELAYSG